MLTFFFVSHSMFDEFYDILENNRINIFPSMFQKAFYFVMSKIRTKQKF